MADNRINGNSKQRRRMHNRRRQQVKRQMILMGAVLLLVVVSVVSCAERCSRNKAQEAAKLEEQKKSKKEKKKKKEETPGEKLTRVREEAEAAGYPDEIIKLLSKNPETVDFVENYGKKKDTVPADSIGEVIKGEIPGLIQWDERWGYAAYGTSTIAVSGCGPTCMSMVVSGLTGDDSITPAVVAAYGAEQGYIDEENNTFWQFMGEASQNWGVSCREISVVEAKVAEELQAGHPIICSVGPGDFTKNGHFIVLVGYENGNVKVHDPFSMENTEKTWVYADIVEQFKAMWVYSCE